MDDGEMPEHVEERLDRYGEIHEQFDRRITVNENYRLQIMGAMKFAAFTLGTALAILSLLIGLGVVTV